ncbi:MAG: mechanosensitive ion channel family protein [Prevotellaceae bacterium]|jgi:miniconductance mechanosensitive channel|nr:mechanosensitive ion channel family protein [Prevotellaceae bacterium]
MIEQIERFITGWLESLSLSTANSYFTADVVLLAAALAVAYGIFYAVHGVVSFVAKKVVAQTGSAIHAELCHQRFFRRLAYFPALIVLNLFTSLLFVAYPRIHHALGVVVAIAFVWAVSRLLTAFLRAVSAVYNKAKYGKKSAMSGLAQAAHTVITIVAIIFSISLLLGIHIGTLFVALGGASAVLMLVFKDSILGLVGGVQLSMNRMVLPGDWIEMPSADADGTVTEISQITVKVQNWDNTIVTIPTYNLISQPVKNWRGMSESGVRRIKRSIYIDMTSVQFCTDDMLARYRNIQYVADYIDQKQTEIAAYNASEQVDVSTAINGRRQTNLGIFRAYLQRYLEHHPQLSRDFTLMARQQQPTGSGIPIEIYVFAKTTEWVKYEAIQSDIFDHIIAAIPYFDLRIFQYPSWNDYQLVMRNM